MSIAVAGAGGHGRVVAEAFMAHGQTYLAGFLDDDPDALARTFGTLRVLGAISSWKEHGVERIALGIGQNHARRQIFEQLLAMDITITGVVHPRATVSPSAEVSDSAIIFAGAVINTGARIGRNVHVNTAAIVEHDCIVGDHAHLAPRSCIGGGVSIGEGSLLGIGCTILPGRTIGKWCVVGAGAVVTHDIADGVVVAGVPARSVN